MQKKQREEALNAGVDWGRTFDEMADLVAVVDKAERIIRVNRTLSGLLGAPPEACMGQLYYPFVHGRSVPFPDCPYAAFMADDQKHVGEVYWPHLGGHFAVSVTPIFDERQQSIGCLNIARDITRDKTMGDELLRIRTALDDCASAVVLLDMERCVVYVNMAFGFLFGHTRDQIKEVHFAAHWRDSERVPEVFAALAEGQPWNEEAAMIGRSGREFPASVRGTPVLDDEFMTTGMLFVIDDLSERKRLEAQVLQAQNMQSIGRLASGVAHEISTPLRYIGDNARFLEDGVTDLLQIIGLLENWLESHEQGPGSPDALRAIRKAIDDADLAYLAEEIPLAFRQSQEGIERVTTILLAMRQFSHPGQTEKIFTDLHQTIESAITLTRGKWHPVCQLKTHFTPGLPEVPCLPVEFGQVMINMIVNATDAIAEATEGKAGHQGRITISTMQQDDCIEIRIADTGGGVPKEAADRLFEPFFTTKDVGRGTGQGLSIAHAVIVEKHGGTLTFESDEGVGTEFTIRLPLTL